MNEGPRWTLFGTAAALTVLSVAALAYPAVTPAPASGWGLVAIALLEPRTRSALRFDRVQLRWLAGTIALAAAVVVTVWALHLMTGVPEDSVRWFGIAGTAVPVVLMASAFFDNERLAAWFVVRAGALSGILLVVIAVYLVLVVGINGTPKDGERDVMLTSMVAAVIAGALALPVRARVVSAIESLLHVEAPSTGAVVSAFGSRMSRAVPMDELLLQLAESLRETIPGTRAEIWTGTAELLTRTVSVPTMPVVQLRFSPTESTTVVRARIGGPAWAAVWLPSLVPEDEHGDFRIVPVAHLGELLGLVAVFRPTATPEFDDGDDTALVELAHQLGLALHNVRLDSALQASLEELAQRNAELQASRLRIVESADAARRGIERNLHDGAQQHLVALAVKLGLTAAIAEDGETDTVAKMLTELREDVQETIKELRELAHGIYPPLLRDRGLGEALHTAANRSVLVCIVDVDLPGRYAEAVETAAYFCILEALQNAGKYAGDGATVTVGVRAQPDALAIRVSDDGAGFDRSEWVPGHGFTNMQDRLGAISGDLQVDSEPGSGTTVTISIPASPLPAT